ETVTGGFSQRNYITTGTRSTRRGVISAPVSVNTESSKRSWNNEANAITIEVRDELSKYKELRNENYPGILEQRDHQRNIDECNMSLGELSHRAIILLSQPLPKGTERKETARSLITDILTIQYKEILLEYADGADDLFAHKDLQSTITY